MKTRYFLVAIILYIAVVIGYIFYVTQDYYTLTNEILIHFSFTLPIAAWFAMALGGVVIIVLMYVILNWFVCTYKKFIINRDLNKITSQIIELALGESPKQRTFTTNDIKQISAMLDRFYLVPNLESSDTKNQKLDSIFNELKQISNGSESKYIKLNVRNPLYLQSLRNFMGDDPQKSLEVLMMNIQDKSAMETNISIQDVYDLAWDNILKSKNAKIIKKALQLNSAHISSDIIKKICLLRIQDKNALLPEEIINICKMANLNEREYLDIVISLCHYVNSNNISFWLDIFDKLSKEVERSVFAYFYFLLEVGKTNEAMDLKKQYPKNDYLSVSAFIALRDKGYPLLVFFDPLLYRANKPESNLHHNRNALRVDYEVSNK
ncbi:hypothetical protein LS73_005925 [Helicobacter muridarum]|uniref:Periplasmic protein n=1 Tax=Helicobacter muridarum TaxID=216 RepID=A0A099U0L6_9HELI|nr:hypothetical protein [Helicobacter muridarum]TLE00067.1 hypothetical protein LS73_005925 [Helicobacter muridarum]STQ86085.1 periplasmic protein [Helicobacter muridarum]